MKMKLYLLKIFVYLRTDITRNTKTYEHMVNEYTKLDPTLPRTTTIKCPNQECKSNNQRHFS